MDLTALDLGLRNRQLLQVKCFLRIQVETFRYFLSEEFPRQSSTIERVASLNKFFAHDWQNVINKIVSVAVVNMTGDYTSKMFAISLFRSMIQSCNQLMVIVSSIDLSYFDGLFSHFPEDSSKYFLSRSISNISSSSSNPSTPTDSPETQLKSIKDKIFYILFKQINSISSNLEKIYNANSSGTECSSNENSIINLIECDSKQSLTESCISNKDGVPFHEVDMEKFEELFAEMLENDQIALFQYLCLKQQNEISSKFNPNNWNNIIEMVLNYVSKRLRNSDINAGSIGTICNLLSQTGISHLYLLFSLFIQTSDSRLRQKLLNVFFHLFSDVSSLESAVQQELVLHQNNISNNFEIKEVNFGRYLQIMSIIDLYIFCYRPKLNEVECLEISIDWILNASSELCSIKSLILPALEEIRIHDELFVDWKILNEQIYIDVWPHIHQYFINENDLRSMVTAESVWTYWIDSNRLEPLIDWIEHGFTVLPYCPNITMHTDFEICQKMVHYLIENGSFIAIQKLSEALYFNPNFFAQHSLFQLAPEHFSFQTMLAQIGRSDHLLKSLDSELNCDNLLRFFVENNSPESSTNLYFELSQLIDYCLDNELYEFVYILYCRYTAQIRPIVMKQTITDSNNRKSLVMKLLCDFIPVDSKTNIEAELVFEKSILITKFFYEKFGRESDKLANDALSTIVRLLIEDRRDIELALIILSFSDTVKFDDFAKLIQMDSNSGDIDLITKIWHILHSKYPLLARVFQLNKVSSFPVLLPALNRSLSAPALELNEKVSTNLPSIDYNQPTFHSAPGIDIYSLLQLAIPFVNITRFFKWQILRRITFLRSKSLSGVHSSQPEHSPEKSVALFENNELPHFSQKRLTELYGLKAELTSSYYLKNSRLIETFFHCFNPKSSLKSQRDIYRSINLKHSIKATRKAALIAYGSVRQNSVFSCCILFQSLIKSYASSSFKSESSSAKYRNNDNSNSSVVNELNKEMEKTNLHLALGKLIIEYASDFLSLQSSQQQQNVLTSILRKSHFNGDRASSQKLLDLAAVALKRKYCKTLSTQSRHGKDNWKNTILNIRLHSLIPFESFEVKPVVLKEDQQVNNETTSPEIRTPFEECPLLIECFDWKPLLSFATLFSLQRPLNFLTKCAKEDNWLVFTIFSQMYEISKEEIQGLLRGHVFNNQCIGEHLAKAFENSRRLSAANISDAESRLQQKHSIDSSRKFLYSRIFKGKVSDRSASNSKSFDQDSISPSELQSQVDLNDSENFSIDISSENLSLGSPSQSYFSKLSDENGSTIFILYEHLLSPEVVVKDILQLILEIYQNCIHFSSRTNSSAFSIESAFCTTLLYAAVSLSNPILALLACSIDKAPHTPIIEIKSPGSSSSSPFSNLRSKPNDQETVSISNKLQFTSLMVWLLASVNPESKKKFIDSYISGANNNKNFDKKQTFSFLADCYLKWSSEKSLYLIDVLTQQDTRNFIILLHGFEIFSIDIPILHKLLQFLIQFFIEKDYYQSDELLREFQSLLMAYNEEEKVSFVDNCGDNFDESSSDEKDSLNNFESLRIVYTKNWIEKCSLVLIVNSLLLAQQFELGILLSHYNFVRIQDSFTQTDSYVPDIRRLYLLSQCLAKLPNFSLPISQLLQRNPLPPDNLTSLSDSDDSQYVKIFRKLIFDLQEAGHFEEARNLVNLLPKCNANEFIINEWMLKAKKYESSVESNHMPLTEDSTLSMIDMNFWENCWTQVTKLDPTLNSAFKVMERFVQHLEPSKILIKCFLFHKCMLAIESILKNSIESDNISETEPPVTSQISLDDSSTSDSFQTNNYDLVQDYFYFEESLWKSAVECEYLISQQRKQIHDKVESNSFEVENTEKCSLVYNEDDTSIAWNNILNDIINYIKKSKMESEIIANLSTQHSFIYKNITQKRHKQPNSLPPSKCDALNKVIEKLLNSFCLKKAREVSTTFGYLHDDFEIIQACDDAARGILKNLTDAPLVLQLKIQNLDSLNTFQSSSSANFNLRSDQKRTMSLIQTFSNFATIGKKACDLILLYYKISSILGISYSNLMDSAYSSLKLFQLLLASNQFDQHSVRNDSSLTALEQSLTSSMESASNVEVQSVVEETETFNQSTVINNYMEAIACAKDLIKLVGEQDEDLNTEEKISDHLVKYIHGNVKCLVEQQFEDNLVTEIEFDKNQLSFNSARLLVLNRLLHEPSILGHKLINVCRQEKLQFEDNCDNFVNNKIVNSENRFSSSTQSTKVSGSANDFSVYKRKHYVLLVELYICAHECFTVQCDVRGIALVLRKTRLLITQELQPVRFFHLILRLLTGIGRYSEMTYCFDLFRECDRFELILSKRVKRTPQLRIALLNYIKNAEPADELLPLVALRFFLYREAADHHRSRAESLFRKFCIQHSSTALVPSQPASQSKFGLSPALHSSSSYLSLTKRLTSSSSFSDFSSSSTITTTSSIPTFTSNSLTQSGSLKDQLEIIMYEFQDAESNYSKASSHTNADYCARKAQLIALQISYINQNKTSITSQQSSTINNITSPISSPNVSGQIPFILNLDQNKVREFTFQCSNFFEALIVSKAYPDVSIDWVDPIFNNVLLSGNIVYLKHFATTHQVTLNLLDKLVKRFEQLSLAFKRNSISNRSLTRDYSPSPSQPLPHSPSSFMFNSLLNQIRSESEHRKVYEMLEKLLEQFLCEPTEIAGHHSSLPKLPPSNFNTICANIEKKFQLAKRFKSNRIIHRLLETDSENSAYLFDLKRNNRL